MKDLSLNDFVYIKENELDKDFCQHIIDKFEKDDRKSQGIVGGGLRPDIKKSTDLSMTHYSGWEEEDKIFYKSLNKNIINYEKVVDILSSHNNKSSDNTQLIWNLIVFQCWIEKIDNRIKF